MSTVRHPRKIAIVRGLSHAEVAELVDALASGASGLMVVEVQVLFSAPNVLTAPFRGRCHLWQKTTYLHGAKFKRTIGD